MASKGLLSGSTSWDLLPSGMFGLALGWKASEWVSSWQIELEYENRKTQRTFPLLRHAARLSCKSSWWKCWLKHWTFFVQIINFNPAWKVTCQFFFADKYLLIATFLVDLSHFILIFCKYLWYHSFCICLPQSHSSCSCSKDRKGGFIPLHTGYYSTSWKIFTVYIKI